jgi:hypothetical protein
MADPADVWRELEARLLSILRSKQNEKRLYGKTPEIRAKEMVDEIRSGFIGDPQPRSFSGPTRFLRNAALPTEKGPDPYGGWWFNEVALASLSERVSFWPMPLEHRRNVERHLLRQRLAISYDWNLMKGIWLLEIPVGETLPGLIGTVAEQPAYSHKHPDYDPSWKFLGGETQIYFPVINPLWVTFYE